MKDRPMSDRPDKNRCVECHYCIPEITCFNRLLMLDSQIEALKQEREALAQEREALRAEREKLAALYQLNMRVLNIVNAPPEKVGKNETDFTRRFTQ